jgi:hypothetical protein
LREGAPYIDDAGFTARVLQQLPHRPKRLQAVRAVILFLSAVLASALSFVLSGNAHFVAVTVERIATLPVLWLLAIAAGVGAVVTSAGLTAAIYKMRQPQSY